jgi:hypothetical protein
MRAPTWCTARARVAARPSALALVALLAATSGLRAQPTGGTDPTIPGTAVVHVTPIAADTLPIVCRDRDRPELGFVTEAADAEWTPRLTLALSRPNAAPDQATVTLELDGTRYSATFPSGESGEGYYTALAEVTSGDGSPPRMISFTATRLEHLERRD